MSHTVLLLARFQFAMTIIFHFLIVPLTIGLLTFLVITETAYAITKKDVYLTLTKQFSKVYLYSFAVGVVTGIIQEFQFGMNWSDYARFVGDIFGAPLAIEGLLAFFLESTFLGFWMFSWNKVGPKVHALLLWLVYIGSLLSAVWILIANSFMQSPAGYQIKTINGQKHAVLTSFKALLTNGQFRIELPHVLFACFLTGAFVVAGLSAYQIYKNKHVKLYRKAMNIALIIAIPSVFGAFIFGDLQGKRIVWDEPMKFAATEAIWEDTGDPAPWNAIAGIDMKNHKNNWAIEQPGQGSFLAYGKTSGALKGMNSLQKDYEHKYGAGRDYYPPVKTMFWTFRGMVLFDFVMLFFAIIGLVFMNGKWHKKDIFKRRNTLRMLMIGIFVPFFASIFGWIVTEMGRYPFTVYGLLTMEDSVSPSVTAPELVTTITIFALIYLSLGSVMVYLSRRAINQDPYAYLKQVKDDPENTVDPFAKGAFDNE